MSNQINSGNPKLISYNTLRKTVGWLGISLPAAMLLGNYFFAHCYYVQDSISNYYYTATGNLLEGILCAVAMFLFAYKGYEKIDNISTSLAGLFALGVAMFPTNNNSSDSCAILNLPFNTARNHTHYIFAASFFITLALISFFLFTKSNHHDINHATPEKRKRNMLYRVCGMVIFLSIVLIAVYDYFETGVFKSLEKYKPVFCLEWVALIAFGVSWLTKGELIWKDKKLA